MVCFNGVDMFVKMLIANLCVFDLVFMWKYCGLIRRLGLLVISMGNRAINFYRQLDRNVIGKTVSGCEVPSTS